jgi:asparagine synthase (glutamine-hydrolysing)
MSGLAGVFKFDPRDRVSESELDCLANEINPIGPDGGHDHVDHHLGMACRAFHTTPESHRETQPLEREGCILTWDGRLDNRDEIGQGIGWRSHDKVTDAEFVLEAYKKWDTGCFAQLLGDWALALWDGRKGVLLLARDCFGVRPLYYRADRDGVRWSSTLKSLVLHAPYRLTLDFEHLASCICPYPRLGTTPYVQVRAVLPAHFLSFRHGGKTETSRYWALDPRSRIRYDTDAEYEEHFRVLLRTAVGRRIRSDRPILCELSGGLDSSSILCVADEIRAQTTGLEISTLSFYNPEEPSGDERPYISVIEKLRGAVGYHISVSDFNRQVQEDSVLPLPDEYFASRPGYFRSSLHWAERISEAQRDSNSRVILSGLGGDEFLGGVQYEALELAEYLYSGRLLPLLRSMSLWSLARRKPLIGIIRELGSLCLAPWFLDSFTKPPTSFNWLRCFPRRQDPFLRSFSSWRKTAPAHLCAETSRYTLASMLSCVDPPLVGHVEKRYPYLDRELYEFMSSIPREQVIRPRQRRSLMRRSLRGIVPDAILDRRTKWFGNRSPLRVLRDQQTVVSRMLQEPWLSDGVLVDVSLLGDRLRELEHGNVTEAVPLRAAISTEQWLRSEAKNDRLVVAD